MKIDPTKITSVRIVNQENKLVYSTNKIFSMMTIKYKDGKLELEIKEV